MIRAISDTVPACYGVGGCPHHATCVRYAAVEQSSPDHTVATCADGVGGWPLHAVVDGEKLRKACTGCGKCERGSADLVGATEC